MKRHDYTSAQSESENKLFVRERDIQYQKKKKLSKQKRYFKNEPVIWRPKRMHCYCVRVPERITVKQVNNAQTSFELNAFD